MAKTQETKSKDDLGISSSEDRYLEGDEDMPGGSHKICYRFPYIKFHCVIGRNPRRRTTMYDLLGFLPLAL